MLIDVIAGARPNFIKIASILHAMDAVRRAGAPLQYRLVHTGQHRDRNMSAAFFEQLHIPEPQVQLGVGGGTQAEMTAQIMLRYEAILRTGKPAMVLVVGDVTSTLACAVAAKKMNDIPVIHVEAGIRSGDWTMPEEINRIVTDSVTDYFFTTSHSANDNLRNTGIPASSIFFVGNTMIDTLLRHRSAFARPQQWDEIGLEEGKYFVLTLHRAALADDGKKLERVLRTVAEQRAGYPVIFPVHPRTANTLKKIRYEAPEGMHLTTPLPYLEFNYLVEHAAAVLTDSGGITEEATVLGVPCMTLRSSTERPETCTIGTNELVGTSPDNIAKAMQCLLRGEWKIGSIPPLWDGRTSERIVRVLSALANGESPECYSLAGGNVNAL